MLMNEEITSWFNTEVFAGIDSVMHDAGYDISLFQHVDTRRKSQGNSSRICPSAASVDAVFVTSFGVDREGNPAAPNASHVPIIGINTPTQSGFRRPTISIDDEDGMFTAAQHPSSTLATQKKHQCTCAPTPSTPSIPSIDSRGQGFIRACKTMEHARLQVARRFRAAWQDVRRFGLIALLALDESGRHLLPDGYDGDSAGAAFGTVTATTRLLITRLSASTIRRTPTP